MSAEISPEIIKTTQSTLGQFVKRPPLTEKLLKKPPFRFLHDVVTAVIKTTGFFDGLFTDDELISDNVKDREKKIIFLQKIIKVVNIVTQSSLSVRPSKIISGQEPELTNELLQKIGEALQQNLTSNQAVKMVTSNDVPPKAVGNEKILKNDIKVPKSEKKVPEKETKTRVNENQSKKPQKLEPNSKNKIPNKLKKTEENKRKPILGKNVNNEVNLKPQKLIDSTRDVRSSKRSKDKKQNSVIENSENEESLIINTTNNIENNASPKDVNSESEVQIDVSINQKTKEKEDESRPTSRELGSSTDPFASLQNDIPSIQNEVYSEKSEREASAHEDLKENIIGDVQSIENEQNQNKVEQPVEPIPTIEIQEQKVVNGHKERAKSTKPPREESALSKSNKVNSLDNENEMKPKNNGNKSPVKSTNVEIKRPKTSLRPPSVRPSSSRPGAPRFKDNNVDIITNTTENMPKAKVNIIIENYGNQPEEDDGSVIVEQTVFDENIVENEFSKSQVESAAGIHGHLVQQILETKKELDGDNSKVEIEWEWGARREREASYKEVEGLRNGLQSLSRAANPLGKLMDFVQEDVEIMRQELLHWRDARKNAADTLKHQESLTEKSIQPLEAKLKQLDDSIVDQMEFIYTVKANLYRNAQKIRRLIDRDDSKY